MIASISQKSMEDLVDLTRSVVERRKGMAQHVRCNVLPYLGPPAQGIIRDLLITTLDEEEDITPDLALYTETAIVEIRNAIAAGTTTKQIPIPGERLIGCKEAFDTKTVVSPNAQALKDALIHLQGFYNTVEQALTQAEAVRLSIRMLDLE